MMKFWMPTDKLALNTEFGFNVCCDENLSVL